MKKRREIFDRFFDRFEEKIYNKRSLLLVIILFVISCVLSYNVYNQRYMAEVAKYSEDDYKALENYILNDVYNEETNSFTFSNIPNNINITDLSIENGKTSFTCSKNKGFKYILNPTIFVKTSDSTISVVPQSKEIATSKIRTNIIAICEGLLFILIPLFIIMSLYFICRLIFIVIPFPVNSKHIDNEVNE